MKTLVEIAVEASRGFDEFDEGYWVAVTEAVRAEVEKEIAEWLEAKSHGPLALADAIRDGRYRGDECSICRRRHGREIVHHAE